MALLFVDSFDHYVTADLAEKWTLTAGTVTINAGTGRRSTSSLRLGSPTASARKTLWHPAPSGATAIVGFAFRPSSFAGGTDDQVCLILLNGATLIMLTCNADGTLAVYRGARVTLLGTTAFALSVNTYYYIELKVLLSDTVGTVDLYIDGTNRLSLSGIDTSVSGQTTWNAIELQSPAGSADFDDLYAADTSGSAINDVLGDVRVDAHFPNANGTNNGSTPSTGVDRYATIDEAAPNDDTDYNSLAASGDKDTLNFPNYASSGSAILGMQVNLWSKKSDAGVGTLTSVVRHGGVDYDHATPVPLTTGYFSQQYLYEVNPGTSVQITEADFNGFEIGYKRTA